MIFHWFLLPSTAPRGENGPGHVPCGWDLSRRWGPKGGRAGRGRAGTSSRKVVWRCDKQTMPHGFMQSVIWFQLDSNDSYHNMRTNELYLCLPLCVSMKSFTWHLHCIMEEWKPAFQLKSELTKQQLSPLRDSLWSKYRTPCMSVNLGSYQLTFLELRLSPACR